ncbi:endonuclease V isoform X1 [Ochotona princeps]|uniref:endonuclease V isoform X1 n=1 Tax=Ochotona princeps TaxID=9978 RepID=UPI0027148795|nr:endonuclease V isoform X1 [Ochotona princeps]
MEAGASPAAGARGAAGHGGVAAGARLPGAAQGRRRGRVLRERGQRPRVCLPGGAQLPRAAGDRAQPTPRRLLEHAVLCLDVPGLAPPPPGVVYEESRLVSLTAPYVSGFLAFREAPFLVDAVQRLQEKAPDLMPQVLLVDGNGVLHHQGFGVACHLGVLTDLPCIGVAKKLLQVDGLENDARHKEQIQLLRAGGETFPLIGGSGAVLGMALRSHDRSTKPLYVSVGHRVSLETAVRLTHHCCRFRVPEPVRQADIRSREHVRRTLGLPAPGQLSVMTRGQKVPRPSGSSREPEGEGDPLRTTAEVPGQT